MSNLTQWQQFQRSWLMRSAIGQEDLHIGMPAIKATMTNDYSRMLAGSQPMSNQSAYAAMESAQAGHVLSADPSSHGNIFTNAFNDVRGLATGIFHVPMQMFSNMRNIPGAVGTLAGGALGSFAGPWGEAFGAQLGGDIGNALNNSIQHKEPLKTGINSALQMVPGITDAENLLHGNIGYFYQHPIFSALDIAGTGHMLADVTGLTRAARTSARLTADQAQADVVAEEGSTSGPSAIPVPVLSDQQTALTFSNMLLAKHPIIEMTQRALKRANPVQAALYSTLGPWGLYDNSLLVTGRHILNKLGQSDFSRITSQVKEAMGDSTPDEIRQAWFLLQDGSRSWDDIMGDKSVPENTKRVMNGYVHLVDEYNKVALDAGVNVKITRPSDGKQEIVGIRSEAAKVMRAYDKRTKDLGDAITRATALKADSNAAYQKLNGRAWDPPAGDVITGKLTAQEYMGRTITHITGKGYVGAVDAPGVKKGAIQAAEQRFREIFTPTGPARVVESALATGDQARITLAISSLKRRLNSKFYRNNQDIQQLKSFISEYTAAQKLISNRTLRRVITAADKAVAEHTERVNKGSEQIDRIWNRLTADKYEVVIGKIMTNKLTDLLAERSSEVQPLGKGEFIGLPATEEQLAGIYDLLNSGNLYPTDMRLFIDSREFQRIRRSAINEYDKNIVPGARVYWVPKVSESERPMVRVSTDHAPSEDSANARAMNFSYSIQNPMLGITKAWAERMSVDASDEYFGRYVKPRLKTYGDMKRQMEENYLVLRQMETPNLPSYPEFEAHNLYNAGWKKFNWKQFMHPDSRYVAPGSEDETYFIRKEDESLLRKMNDIHRTGMSRAWDASMGLFRTSVLTVSLRFLAHIVLGGAFMTLVKTGPDIVKYYRSAHSMLTDEHNYLRGGAPPSTPIPVNVARGTGFEYDILKQIYNKDTFHMQHMLGGRTLGRLHIEAVAKRLQLDKPAAAAHAYHDFLETLSDHYRVMAYLYGRDHALKRGDDFLLTKAEQEDADRNHLSYAEYAGVKLANKVLANNLTRSPIEQTAIRFLLPFGGWTKHVLRYTLTLPLDHPLRTNILASLAAQAYTSDNTGLPEYLFHLLFLGHPDVNGNVTAVDFRQWNPLRDVANYMTLAGWVTQMNPLAQGVLSAMGINSATGTPELYPNLTYDSFYGGFKAQNPTGNTLESMVSAYIPESGVLDHFFKYSSYMKGLARYDPQSYRQQLYQSMNFPWMPQTINLNQIIAKQETDRLSVMKQMVTQALVNNDPSYLANEKGPWPYQGWYFSSQQVRALITAANNYAKQTGQSIPAADLMMVPTAPAAPVNMQPPALIVPAAG